MNDELKEWQVQNAKGKIALLLIGEKIPFAYTEEEGIVFAAPKSYVEKLKFRLRHCYGCRSEIVITEYEEN